MWSDLTVPRVLFGILYVPVEVSDAGNDTAGLKRDKDKAVALGDDSALAVSLWKARSDISEVSAILDKALNLERRYEWDLRSRVNDQKKLRLPEYEHVLRAVVSLVVDACDLDLSELAHYLLARFGTALGGDDAYVRAHCLGASNTAACSEGNREFSLDTLVLSRSGDTALHLAALNDNIMLVTALLESGVRVDVTSDDGHRPIDYAEDPSVRLALLASIDEVLLQASRAHREIEQNARTKAKLRSLRQTLTALRTNDMDQARTLTLLQEDVDALCDIVDALQVEKAQEATLSEASTQTSDTEESTQEEEQVEASRTLTASTQTVKDDGSFDVYVSLEEFEIIESFEGSCN
ncbi:MAG: hypothetical protein MHM6MM_003299 [Cercozoa sp. M6MM]